MVSGSQNSLQLSWLRRYMYELGRVVPIVPVVCKSDCMTVAEQACPAEEEVFLAIRYSQAEQSSWRFWCCRPAFGKRWSAGLGTPASQVTLVRPVL